MLRKVLFAALFTAATLWGQESSSSSAPKPEQAAASSAEPSEEVLAAEAAITQSNWKAAETKLNLWLSTHVTDARALFDLGYVCDAQNRFEDALGAYRRAIAANPSSFEAHLSLGLLLARLQKPDEARAELATATQLDPGAAGPELKARAWRALAKVNQQTGDPVTASHDLLEALKIAPETVDDTLLAATLAEQNGQPDQAEAAYRRLLEKDPKSMQASAALAHLLIAKKQYAEAETLLRAALEKTPGDPALTAQLAAALAGQDKPEALPLTQKLYASHPENPAIARILAELLSESGDAAGSDAIYVKLLARTPQDAGLLVSHGQNLVRTGALQEAFAVFDKATKIAPANADAWSGLAFAASRTNRPEITLQALTARARYLSESPSTYFLWATAYDTLHKKAQAADYYKRFLTAAAGKFPTQEWQAHERLKILAR